MNSAIRKFSAAVFLVLASALLGLEHVYIFVWAMSSDHRQRVVDAVMAGQSGHVHRPALIAAVAARFPDGAPSAQLHDFAKQLSGSCNIGDTPAPAECRDSVASAKVPCARPLRDTLYCKVPLSGALCMTTFLGFHGRVRADGTISGVSASIYTIHC